MDCATAVQRTKFRFATGIQVLYINTNAIVCKYLPIAIYISTQFDCYGSFGTNIKLYKVLASTKFTLQAKSTATWTVLQLYKELNLDSLPVSRCYI